MSYASVLAFGDSTTAGCELLDTVDWEETKKLSFPNQLAGMLGVPCYNYAWPGGSNDRSLRLLPEALLMHPNSLVLFTYTSFDRSEFFTEDPELPQSPDGYSGLGGCWLKVKSINKHQKLNTAYLRDFYTDTDPYNRYKAYNMMLGVQLLCKQYASNFVQIFLYNRLLLPPVYQDLIFKELDPAHIHQFDFSQKGIEWEYNNEGYGSLNHWANMKGYSFCPGGHIGQDAHNNFAKRLYNKL